jgi:hypothetical protein
VTAGTTKWHTDRWGNPRTQFAHYVSKVQHPDVCCGKSRRLKAFDYPQFEKPILIVLKAEADLITYRA